jgi:ribonuclease HII
MINFKDFSLQEIKDYFKTIEISEYKNYYNDLLSDNRKSVLLFADHLQRQENLYNKEILRTEHMITAQKSLFDDRATLIAGIDEVGRGPLAGPVVACAAVMKTNSPVLYLNDSKKLTAKRREELYQLIYDNAVSIGIGIIDNARIDKINILNATKEAMMQAVKKLSITPDALLIDALLLPCPIKQAGPSKADENYYSVAAASIIAKVTRDHMMKQYALKYPMYEFDANKGYGTSSHIAAIHKYGPCTIHRQSFIKKIFTVNDKKAIGNSGEVLACEYILNKGYCILEKNYRSPYGEIDVIYKDHEYLVFCEVKTRKNTDYGTGSMAVSYSKISKITQTALCYITQNDIQDTDIRFDIIEIYENNKIVHIDNAFTAMA